MHRVALAVALVVLTGVLAGAQTALPPVRVGNGVPPPVKTKDVKPVYPADAQMAHVEGVVTIEATIGPDGHVAGTRIVRSVPMLDAAAVESVRQWEFTPTVVDGVPRTVVMTVVVNFSLGGPRPSVPPDGGMVLLMTLGTPGHRQLVFEITRDRAEHLPRWDQRTAPVPPLSMDEARNAAERWLGTRTRDPRTFDLASLSLLHAFPTGLQAASCAASGCWYYRIALTPFGGDRPIAADSMDFTAVVLLDGSIVEPRTVPAPVVDNSPRRPDDAPTDRGPGDVYRYGDNGITMPRVLQPVKASYTAEAMRAKIQGTVVLEATIKTDGTVDDVRVVKSLDSTFGLDEEAIKAARQWRFEPGSRLGVPVPVRVTMEMSFAIGK